MQERTRVLIGGVAAPVDHVWEVVVHQAVNRGQGAVLGWTPIVPRLHPTPALIKDDTGREDWRPIE